MITCSKTYRDVPLSHRQPLHPGKCSRIHGHSWSISITFFADRLDENGFVIDFGELHFIEDWIDRNLDHGIVLCSEDGQREAFESLQEQGLLRITWVESSSCEGIAKFLFETFDAMVREKTGGRVGIHSLKLDEDSKNSATYVASKS